MSLNSGLVGFWQFTGDATDSSGNGLDGTVTGATLTTDKNSVSNQAYSFSGTSQYITVGNQSALKTDYVTVSAWIKLDNVTGEKAVWNNFHFDAGYYGYQLKVSDDELKFNYGTDSAVGSPLETSTDANLVADTWYHVVATYDGTDLKLYKNGTLLTLTGTSTTGTLEYNAYTYDAGIGKNENELELFYGKIDEVRIYDRALTGREVKQLYQGYDTTEDSVTLAHGIRAGLWAEYHFTGNTNDSAFNGRHLTNNGADLTTDVNSVSNQAYDFVSANSDYMQNASVGFSSTQISYSYWVKSSATGIRVPINCESGATDVLYDYLNLSSSGDIAPYFSYGGSWTRKKVTGTGWNDGSWHHIVVTADFPTDTITIYVDGIDQGAGTYDGTSITQLDFDKLTIGGDATGNQRYMNAQMDEWKIWDRVITQYEVTQLYEGYDTTKNQVGVLDTDAVAIYHFTGNANDETGNNDGSVTDATLTTDKNGVSNQAYDFNGSTAYISYGSDASIDNIFNSGGAISLWVNPTSGSSNYDRIMEKTGWTLMLYDESGGDVRFLFQRGHSSTNGNWYTTARHPMDVWSHIIVVYDDDSTTNNPTMYLNGVEVALTEWTTPAGTKHDDVSNTLYTGAYQGASAYMDGKIDEARLYTRILTDTEVKQLYYGYDVSDTSYDSLTGDPLGIWHFTGNANDSSPAGNDLTVYNATLTTDINNESNQAYDFDGTGDYLEYAGELVDWDEDWSISVWHRLDTENAVTDQIIGIGDSASATPMFSLRNYENAIKAYIRDSGSDALTVSSAVEIVLGQWYHTVFTWDASTGTGTIYVDGEYKDDGTNASIGGGHTFDYFDVGVLHRTGFDDYWDGVIDEVRLYNRVLTVDEVSELYHSYDTPTMEEDADPTPSAANNALMHGDDF